MVKINFQAEGSHGHVTSAPPGKVNQSHNSGSTQTETSQSELQILKSQLRKQNSDLSKHQVYRKPRIESKCNDKLTTWHDPDSKQAEGQRTSTVRPRDKVPAKKLISWPKDFPNSAWKSNL